MYIYIYKYSLYIYYYYYYLLFIIIFLLYINNIYIISYGYPNSILLFLIIIYDL